jgi:integrase
MEQRQVDWSEIATKIERDMGHSYPFADGENSRELALFNLAIDSKLRGCDLVKLKVFDVAQGNRVSSRAIVMQQKTHRPVQFEITEQTRYSLASWLCEAKLKSDDYLFPSWIHDSPHLSTRQYARIVEHWVKSIGLDPAAYRTHTMRTTKATALEISEQTEI